MIGRAGLVLLGVLQGGPMSARAESPRPAGPPRAEPADATPSLARVRSLYLAAVSDESAIDRGLEEIERVRARASEAELRRLDGALTAYQGALTTLRAKHALWPPAKLRHLRRGLATLDAGVAAHPDAAEIRYLRLMSCYYLPSVLGRTASVREDFAALARLLPRQRTEYPSDAYDAIVRFVLDEGELSPEQRAPLERALRAEDA